MKSKLELLQPNDTPAMRAAVKALRERKIFVTRTSRYQLKVGPFNFWPDRGTIVVDDQPPITEKGLEAFLSKLPKRQITLDDNGAD